MSSSERPANPLPDAQTVTIGRRGTTAVWDCPHTVVGDVDPGDPILLLHGWNVDARLNFASAVSHLQRRSRVVLFDLHGHGAGVRPDEGFELERCADDAIAVLDALGIERATVVGYSLGGAIAQVLGRDHPERCAGIVLAATADRFSETRLDRTRFAVLTNGARAMRRLPPRPRTALFQQISAIACRQYPNWVLDTVRQADPVSLLEAGSALGAFDSTEWARQISPTSAVVVTASDTVVDPARQRRLATRLEAAHVIEVDADHDLPIRNDPRFAAALGDAVEVVSGSARTRSVG